ncbi:MAG: hypothetical protein LBT62_06355, partial [Deltaproteobacteria bacterium]|jgi:hypothetical protein|nr:hypothetical protein [Deltaproteobacteria bacterium]
MASAGQDIQTPFKIHSKIQPKRQSQSRSKIQSNRQTSANQAFPGFKQSVYFFTEKKATWQNFY